MDAEQKRVAIRQIALEVNTGLIDDEECCKRLDEIGATDEELEEATGLIDDEECCKRLDEIGATDEELEGKRLDEIGATDELEEAINE